MPLPLALTPGQASVWFGQAARPGSGEYQCAELLTFDAPPDIAVLSDTISTCLDQVPALQSVFTTDASGAPVMAARPHRYEVEETRVPEDTDVIEWCTRKIFLGCSGELSGEALSGHSILHLPGGQVGWLARFHHIVGDGLSISAIIRWIAATYTAVVQGEERPEAPFQDPADVLAAARSYASNTGNAGKPSPSEADRQYWTSREIPLDLSPLGTPRDNSSEPAVHAVHAAITQDTRARLRAAAKDTGSNEAVLLAAATGHYFAALSGAGTSKDADPVSLGLPLMNRPLGQRETAVDPAVNVLPLLIPPRRTIAESIETIGESFDGARRHGAYRAEDLRRDIGLADPDRHLTGPSFNMRPFTTRFTFGESVAELTTISIGPVHDLEFIFQSENDGGMDLHVLADTSLHDRRSATAHAERLAGFITRMVETLEREPQARWEEVDLLGEDERKEVIERFNDTEHALRVPADSTLMSLLDARRDADLASPTKSGAPGLWHNGNELTWGELWAEVDAFADHLRVAGIGSGDVVAIHLRRGPALCIAIAGTVAAGAAWTPLSPDLPASRLDGMIARAAPRLLVTGTQSDIEFSSKLRIDEDALRPSSTVETEGIGTSDVIPAKAAQPEDTAYVLFTSGSTGEPKAVAVPHEGIVNRLEWMCDYYAIGEADTLMQKTACSFDVSVWEFLLPFTHGVRLAIAGDGVHLEPARMAVELRASGTTFCHFVPSALKVFLDAAPGELPDLAQVVVSGEALDAGIAETCVRSLDVALHNLYGPTEASIDVTAFTYRGEATIPIGAPVWNTRCYVLDDKGRPLPVGAPGRLFLAGVQLARGYLGQPELTDERFVLDPFAGEASAGPHRMYATGDIASWRSDGQLLYHGRNDSQVKLRGQRLELGEIEAVVGEHEKVGVCAVVARTLGGQLSLVAYIVPSDSDVDVSIADEVKAHAASNLPHYMVPLVVTLDELPMTINGKLDQRALPAPAELGDHVSAADEREDLIARHFADELGLDDVSVTANFFDLGGNSLVAVRLATALSEALGDEVSIADIFGAKTVRRLARTSAYAGEASQALSPWFPLRHHERSIPVLCFHPAGGLGWSYAGLVSHLEPGRGVYAVQSPGIADNADSVVSITDGARRASEDFFAQLDSLPADARPTQVDLVGWSVGGVLAQETAVTLQAHGIEIRRLVLLDAYPAELWKGLPSPTDVERLEGMLTMAGVDRSDVTMGADGELNRNIVLDAIRARGGAFGSLPETALSAVIDMVGHNARIMKNHDTRRYDGDVHFFKAALNSEAMDEKTWRPFVTDLDVAELPVSHPGLVAPASLKRLARVLAE